MVRSISTLLVALVAWLIVVMTFAWILLVVSTSLFYAIFFDGVYIHASIRTTLWASLITLGWVVLVYVGSKAWHLYNKHKLNMQKNEDIPLSSELLFLKPNIQWSEATMFLSSPNQLLEKMDSSKYNLYVDKTFIAPFNEKNSSRNLFNQAVSLMKENKYSQGVSIWRMLLEHPDTTKTEKQIAEIKLYQCLSKMGYQQFTEGLA